MLISEYGFEEVVQNSYVVVDALMEVGAGLGKERDQRHVRATRLDHDVGQAAAASSTIPVMKLAAFC